MTIENIIIRYLPTNQVLSLNNHSGIYIPFKQKKKSIFGGEEILIIFWEEIFWFQIEYLAWLAKKG